jgi:16S rRNA (adenine1518-N6/adenine1519-N6)-dimethyltransferase
MAAMTEHRARKRFGQHFLTDTTVVARMVDAIDPQPEDHLVEIGPGLGVLTAALLARIPALEAVELDRDVIPKLAQRCGALGRLEIHAADALRFDFGALAADGRPLRVVGNLPYNISTPLLFHLLQDRAVIHDMHFMLQKEVVDRLAAQPGGKDYGRLSVMMQYHCAVDALFEVPPTAFEPPPKVDSAVVRLVPHARPPVAVHDEKQFERLVVQAFSQRRKTLRNTLKELLDAEAMAAVGIDAARRAETLSLDEFARLANALPRE